MADRELKVPGNVSGRFYVDGSCIDCDLCRQIAPDSFVRDDDNSQSYVFHQPLTEAEIAAAHDAMDSCPTESIGDDGVEELLEVQSELHG